eukprot:1189198-Prorocentrum_minimum.AAC.2
MVDEVALGGDLAVVGGYGHDARLADGLQHPVRELERAHLHVEVADVGELVAQLASLPAVGHLGERALHPPGLDLRHPLVHQRHELRLLPHLGAEDGVDELLGGGAAAVHGPHEGVEGRRQGVLDDDGDPVLVRAHHVPRERRHRQSDHVHRLANFQQLHDGPAHGVEELHGPVLRDALELVAHVHRPELRDEAQLVLVQVHIRHRHQHLAEVGAEEVEEALVGDAGGYVAVAEQVAEARHGGEPALQHAQLHALHGSVLLGDQHRQRRRHACELDDADPAVDGVHDLRGGPLAELLPEDGADKLLARVVVAENLPHQRVQILRLWVLQGDGLALLVGAHHVARVRGEGEGDDLNRLVHLKQLQDRLLHRVQQLHTPILRQALQLVLDVHVAEAHDQLQLVLLQVHAGHRRHRHHHLREVRLEEVAHARVLHRHVHVAVAQQVAHARDGGVPAVEHAQLHRLVHRHVVHDQRAHVLPLGAAVVHELVLDHPLHEVLRHDGPEVDDAVLLLELPLLHLGGNGRDTVHHGHGEGHVLLDPLAQLGVHQVCELESEPLGDVAVLGDVVAAEHGEGLDPSFPSEF